MGDWRKSTYSSANGGQCIETASANGIILVRDTTDRDGADAERHAPRVATVHRRFEVAVISEASQGSHGLASAAPGNVRPLALMDRYVRGHGAIAWPPVGS